MNIIITAVIALVTSLTTIGVINITNPDLVNMGTNPRVLMESQGGTATSTYEKGDVIFSDIANKLGSLPIGTAGQVLKVSTGGIPEWGTDDSGSGGGGSGLWASTTAESFIYNNPTTYQVMIGANATTTNLDLDLEVSGLSWFTGGFMSYASSTIIGDFRMDGSATTTGSLYIGDDLTVASEFDFVNATSTGSLYITKDFTVATMTDASCDVKATTNGNFYCGLDATGGGGGGSGLWATTTADSFIYNTPVDNIVLIGANATTTNETIDLEVIGDSIFGGFTRLPNIYSTSTLIDTLTFENATSTQALEIGACTGANIDFADDLCVLDDIELEGMGYGDWTGALTGNADTATDLAADPTDCTDNDEYAYVIADSGNLTCQAITGGTGITASAGTWSFDCSEVEGTGINCGGSEEIELDNTGDWTGTFDSLAATAYLENAWEWDSTNLGITPTTTGAGIYLLGSATTTGFFYGDLVGDVTGALTGNADTATDLAADPDDCTNQFAYQIAASGNLTCASVGSTYMDLTDDFTWTGSHDYDGGWLSATTSLDYWLNASSTNATADDITADIVAHTANDDAHHALVTITGQDYLTLSTQQITMGEIEPDDLAASDFGEFDCDGTNCTLDTIDSNYMDMTAAYTWTGAHIFDGGSLEIPQDGTVDATGEFQLNTASSSLEIYDGSAVAIIPSTQSFSFTIASTTFRNFPIIPIKAYRKAITITDIACRVITATDQDIFISDGTNDTETIVCTTANSEDDGSIANGGFDAREMMYVEMGTAAGDPDWLNVTIAFTIDPQ